LVVDVDADVDVDVDVDADDSLALVDTPRTTRTTTEDGVDGSIGVFASRAGVRVSARVVLVVLVGVVCVRVLPRLRRRRGRWRAV
jgi:hypothetical protein